MSQRQRRSWFGGGLLAVLALVSWSLAQQAGIGSRPPAPETLISASSVLYASTDGAALHAEAWSKTAAYQALETSGLLPLLRQTAERLLEMARDEGAPPEFTRAIEALGHLQAHGATLAVAIEPPVNGPPVAWATLVLHRAGKYEEELRELLTAASQGELRLGVEQRQGRKIAVAVIPNTPGVEVGCWNEGGHLVVVAGMGAVDAALKVAAGQAPNATQHPLWSKHQPAAEVDVTTRLWFDFARLQPLMSGIPLPLEPREPGAQPLLVGDLLELLGLDGLQAVTMIGGYRGAAMWGETWIDAPAPRQGLLGLSDGDPILLGDLPPLPQGLSTFTASRLSLAGLYDGIVAGIRKLAPYAPNPDAEAEFEEALAMLRDRLGVDLRRDLLAHLGSRFIVYDDPRQGVLTLGRGLMLEVKNAPALRRSLDAVLRAITEETRGEATVRKLKKHGQELVLVDIRQAPFFNQCLCVTDDWLLYGTPQTIEAELLRLAGQLPAWKPTAEHAAALATMPQEFTALNVSDPRGTVNIVMGLMPALISFAQTGIRASREFPPGFTLPLHAEDFPPAELISGPLFPNVLTAEITEAGFHYRSRASLPGIPTLAGGDGATTVALAGIGTALLLPAVQSARQAAQRAQSQNNLRQIAIAGHNHEAVHREFPAGTIANEKLKPEERLSWMVALLPFVEQQALHQQLDLKQGWQAPANLAWTQNVIEVFLNPQGDFPRTSKLEDGTEVGVTHYVGIAGFGEKGPTLGVNDPQAGWFAYDRTTRMRDVRDGTSNTIMISEASGDHGPWASGGRATVRAFTQRPYLNGPDGIGGTRPNGSNMVFGDGSVRFISSEIDPKVLEGLSTIRGGEVVRVP